MYLTARRDAWISFFHAVFLQTGLALSDFLQTFCSFLGRVLESADHQVKSRVASGAVCADVDGVKLLLPS